jgi:hypothetical protein
MADGCVLGTFESSVAIDVSFTCHLLKQLMVAFNNRRGSQYAREVCKRVVHRGMMLGGASYMLHPKLNAKHCVRWHYSLDAAVAVTQMGTCQDFTISTSLHPIE